MSDFFSLETQPQSAGSGVGLGCLAGLVSAGVSGCAWTCGIALLIPVLLLWLLWYYFSAEIIFAIFAVPSIALAYKYLMRRNPGQHYRSPEVWFSNLIGVAPSTDRIISLAISTVIWALLQGGFAATLLLLFPRHP